MRIASVLSARCFGYGEPADTLISHIFACDKIILASFSGVRPSSSFIHSHDMKRVMATVAENLGSRITLNDGFKMPLFGLGVYLASPEEGGEAEIATQFALRNGYRLIDTAEFYQNEEGVGRGVRLSGLPREDVFVVTKVLYNGYDYCKKTFEGQFKKLDLGYIDLYLMHQPQNKIVETYKAMLEIQATGRIRSVGVSNFGVQHLEKLKQAGLPTPSVNQIELHPYQRKEDIVQYCQEHGITVMGYSPLTKGKRLNDPVFVDMAARYNKSVAQLLIRWSVQSGFITIPKSVKSERIIENSQVFDWKISDDDMAKLNSLPAWSCMF